MDPQTFIAAHPILMVLLSPLIGAIVSDLLDFSRGKVGSAPWSWPAAGRKYLQATAGGAASVLITTGIATAVVGLMLWLPR